MDFFVKVKTNTIGDAADRRPEAAAAGGAQAVIRQSHIKRCSVIFWSCGDHLVHSEPWGSTLTPFTPNSAQPATHMFVFFFFHSVFCISVTWGSSHSMKSLLGAAFAFWRFNGVFAVSPYDISLKSSLERAWQWLLWCLICRGGTSPHTKSTTVEVRLLYSLKQRTAGGTLAASGDEWWHEVKQ